MPHACRFDTVPVAAACWRPRYGKSVTPVRRGRAEHCRSASLGVAPPLHAPYRCVGVLCGQAIRTRAALSSVLRGAASGASPYGRVN